VRWLDGAHAAEFVRRVAQGLRASSRMGSP
jgi:hypothetical protein